MNAEQYLERIENKRIDSTPLYTRKEMIDFAENYANQLILNNVIKKNEIFKIPNTTKKQRVKLQEGFDRK